MERKDMEKFKTCAKIAGVTVAVLVLAPVVAVFGLTVLGLAFGMSVLMTTFVVVMAWRHQQTTEAKTDEQDVGLSEAEPA
jgi:Na+/melibiose symporter-like transporter